VIVALTSWHRIAIHSYDANIAQASAVALVERMLKACRDLKMIPLGEVWHRKNTPTDHEYFLSPKASEILVPLLAGYRPSPCDAPDLRLVKQVLL
jgi:hypothetical protein